MRRCFMLALTVAGLVALLPTRASAEDKPRRGGILTMAIQKDLVLMNPLVATRSTDKLIRDLMFESLLDIDAKGNIKPNLAESWKISSDGKLYAFNLRKGVKFHDGQEMTAEDAKFAIDYSMNPRNGAHGLSRLVVVERVEAADKHNLKIHLKSANPAFLSFVTDIGAFSVVPKESLAEAGARITRYPPGTGPFRFVEWQPRQRIIFERYDDYWGQKAFVERLILKAIADETVRFSALRAGDIDIAERTPYEWIKQIVDGKLKGIGIAEASTAGFRRLVFNVTGPPFNNKKLRQAVVHAMNKKELMHAAFFGFGEQADQKYPKGHAWYIEGVPSPAYNPIKAGSLLKEVGYKGEPLTLMIEQGAVYEAQATTLQAQLKKVGMNVKIEQIEYGSYVQRWQTGNFAFKFSGGSVQADPWLVYAGSLRCESSLKRRAENESGYCDKEVDELFKKAEFEFDPKGRRELFRKILTKVHEDAPDMPIGYVSRFFTFRDRVKGFTTDGEGSFRWSGGGVNYTWLDK